MTLLATNLGSKSHISSFPAKISNNSIDLLNLKSEGQYKNILRFLDMETKIDTLPYRKELKQKWGPNDLVSSLKRVVREHWK